MDKKKSLKNHILFWGVLLFSFALIQFFKEENTESFGAIFAQNLKHLPAYLIATYGFNNVLLQYYYKNRQYILFGLFTIVLFYVASAFDRIFTVYVYEPIFRERPFEQESLLQIFSDWEFLINGYLIPLLMATFAMTINRVIAQKNKHEKALLQLERDKNRAELGALKAQIHPHFLFNTLNNLYALTLQKSDKAPETVATLSAMLDYMLYQCNDKLVPLEKEVTLLENYIALERLRYGDDIEIAFAKANPLPPETQIGPLILLSIIENAFKHGASGSTGIPEIHIDLTWEGSQLYFTVKNTKNRETQVDTTAYTKGIGVSNIKKQLALLYTDYSYEVTDENGWYCVALRIHTERTR
ncbi:sensor histidine kinase [Dokdonia ponticola]|uniref:Sensor histidine kinase n=1 Tax=Dokdonia ponticola TaxID=2041041 RepID=A0ABV9HY37_9FLAO